MGAPLEKIVFFKLTAFGDNAVTMMLGCHSTLIKA
jgi:hypothetical protein